MRDEAHHARRAARGAGAHAVWRQRRRRGPQRGQRRERDRAERQIERQSRASGGRPREPEPDRRRRRRAATGSPPRSPSTTGLRLARADPRVEQRTDQQQLRHAEDHDDPARDRSPPGGARLLQIGRARRTPSTSGAPSGVRRRNAPSRGVSPAPSNRSGTTRARSRSAASPPPARSRRPRPRASSTCSTATAPSAPAVRRRRSGGRARGAGRAPTASRTDPAARRCARAGMSEGRPLQARARLDGVVDRDRDVVGLRAGALGRRPAGRRARAPLRARRRARAPPDWLAMPAATSASAAVIPSNSRRTSDSTRAAAVASVGPNHHRSSTPPASPASAAARRPAASRRRQLTCCSGRRVPAEAVAGKGRATRQAGYRKGKLDCRCLTPLH